MDVRIKGKHEQVLLELARRNGLPTPVAMIRILIQRAGEEANLWTLIPDELVGHAPQEKQEMNNGELVA